MKVLLSLPVPGSNAPESGSPTKFKWGEEKKKTKTEPLTNYYTAEYWKQHFSKNITWPSFSGYAITPEQHTRVPASETISSFSGK